MTTKHVKSARGRRFSGPMDSVGIVFSGPPRAVRQKVRQVGDLSDGGRCRLVVVLESDERDRAPVEEHVGQPRVLIPWLADGADVDDRARGVEAEVVGPVLAGLPTRHEVQSHRRRGPRAGGCAR